MCDVFELDGDVPDENGTLKTEEIELWRRDPVDCIRELIGNPTFREFLKYAPEKLFEKMDGSGRIYDETWTGDWWWEMQVSPSTGEGTGHAEHEVLTVLIRVCFRKELRLHL